MVPVRRLVPVRAVRPFWQRARAGWRLAAGGWLRRLVGEVLGEPDGAGGVADDGDADVGEGTAEDVPAVTVVRGLLVQHVLGEGDRHLGDSGRVVSDRAALADVLPGGGPVHAGGGLAGAESGLARALVGEPAAAGHRRVVGGGTAVQAGRDSQRR